MTICNQKTTGFLPDRLNAFGQIAPQHHSRFGFRFVEGEGGDGAGGEGAGDADDENADDKLGAAGTQALERIKGTLKATKGELAAFKALGLSAEDIAALVTEKDKGEQPDAAKIEKQLRTQIETESREKSAAKFRASNVREQAAGLGFIDPREALLLIDSKALADVDVDDDDEVDAAAVRKLLDALASAKPHLLKPTDTTTDHRSAGIGASGSGTKPDVQPGLARIRSAYEDSTNK